MQAPCPNERAKQDGGRSILATIMITVDRAESNRVTPDSALLCESARWDRRNRISPRAAWAAAMGEESFVGGVQRDSPERQLRSHPAKRLFATTGAPLFFTSLAQVRGSMTWPRNRPARAFSGPRFGFVFGYQVWSCWHSITISCCSAPQPANCKPPTETKRSRLLTVEACDGNGQIRMTSVGYLDLCQAVRQTVGRQPGAARLTLIDGGFEDRLARFHNQHQQLERHHGLFQAMPDSGSLQIVNRRLGGGRNECGQPRAVHF